MNPSSPNAGFTLSELLVAAALSSLVLALFLVLLVNSLGLWREGLARVSLSEQSRVTRERILRGLDGRYGLRHASRSRLELATNQVVFRELFAGATNAFTLRLDTGRPPAYSNAAGEVFLTRSGAFVSQASIAGTGSFLNLDLTLAVASGQRQHRQPQRIRVYLLNE